MRCADISASCRFYSLLGYTVERRFRSGAARAAWLGTAAGSSRLELIEVPSYSPSCRAVDLDADREILGLHHLAIDVTAQCANEAEAEAGGDSGLTGWLQGLNARSEATFKRSVKLVRPPYQLMAGNEVFEVAFVRDPSGALVELLNLQRVLDRPHEDEWTDDAPRERERPAEEVPECEAR